MAYKDFNLIRKKLTKLFLVKLDANVITCRKSLWNCNKSFIIKCKGCVLDMDIKGIKLQWNIKLRQFIGR
jgi:hypothetical protein